MGLMSKQQKTDHADSSVNLSLIFKTWLPLAGSWLLMSMELPAINAVVARLANPEVNLAAYGGVSFAMALTVEAPVIMLLAASTALSRDWQSYQKLQKYSLWLGIVLTSLHLIIAVTPIYGFIVNTLLQVPPEVVEPGRLGLLLVTPWTLAIAYRRFKQGVMIRFGHSDAVGKTTLVRLVTVAVILVGGVLIKRVPGTALAGLAQGLGVTAEAVFAGLYVRGMRDEIKAAPPCEEQLNLKRFIKFYFPLALTSSLWLLWQPLISGAVSRMPDPLESLAVWSVLTGVLFMTRAAGMAFNEVVVALIERDGAFPLLRKFAWVISIGITCLVLLFVLTPLSKLWFSVVANLSPDQVVLARRALTLGLPLGALSIAVSFFQGIIVHGKRTGAVPEAVVMFLVGMGVVLAVGLVTQAYQGVLVASAAFTAAHIMQSIWLFIRSRQQRRLFRQQLSTSEV
jgi:hypothetical protein